MTRVRLTSMVTLWALVAVAVACSQTSPALTPSPAASESVAPTAAPAPRVPQALQQTPSPAPSPPQSEPTVPQKSPLATEEPATSQNPPLPRGEPEGGETQPTHSSGLSVLAPSGVSTDPPDRDLFALAQRLGKVSDSGEAVPRIVNAEPVTYQEGHTETFYVTDAIDNTTHTIQATLQVVSENAYWYVDDAIEISTDDLRKAAEVFENDVRPRMVSTVGDIWSPGVDNDPRLTVLHTQLRGVAGYYGSSDEYPRETHPRSNEREMIYMEGRIPPGSRGYLAVLAHELQHAVHWNLDAGEDVWINEGMSEVVTEQILGGRSAFVNMFLSNPTTQLNFWPDDLHTTPAHYGGATLFLSYMAQHYGGYEDLKHLARERADGINGVEIYLSPFEVGFVDVFEDWVIANYLDAPDGPYSYPDRDVSIQPGALKSLSDYGEDTGELPQFAARYIDLRLGEGDALVDFSGAARVSQVGTECRSGSFCWWSNIGDSIDSTLTREFDLSGLDEATLEFWTWFQIEEDWDFAYVAASTDGGATWDLLEGRHTTTEDPVGNNFGVGLTGSSGQWVKETIDLSPYAGGKVLLRFEYITDDGVNLDGFVVDDIAIPELDFFDDAETDGGWRTEGFQRIDNVLPQRYAVQIIEVGSDGSASVREMPLDEERKGQLLIEGFGTRIEHAVIVIASVTPDTYQPAPYTLTVRDASP